MDEKVLVIDDDYKLQNLLRDYLESYGFEVSSLPDGSRVLETLAETRPDLVILDVMMPGKDGIEVLREMRTKTDVPVIMLTARGEETDRIVGLELGADDYLPKPFNPRELLARIRAVLRRQQAEPEFSPLPEKLIEAAGMKLDTGRKLLLINDDEITLSLTEYKIMEAMLSRPSRVFTRDELLNLARGREMSAFERSVDVHISNLRSKLKPYPKLKKVIKTVWGIGYALEDE